MLVSCPSKLFAVSRQCTFQGLPAGETAPCAARADRSTNLAQLGHLIAAVGQEIFGHCLAICELEKTFPGLRVPPPPDGAGQRIWLVAFGLQIGTPANRLPLSSPRRFPSTRHHPSLIYTAEHPVPRLATRRATLYSAVFQWPEPAAAPSGCARLAEQPNPGARHAVRVF